ncbi:hypothetical protein [Paraburkholderia caballeronis]|uniref:hypothetical protein n=1 Tax=Paraburkholderia caballeronis TaxID=416943 RepID=UPI001FBACCA1|nr:hypothetical protein [Paraburkholderia caballeronis]
MIWRTHPAGNLHRSLTMLGVLIGLAGCSLAHGQRNEGTQMTTQPTMTIWQAIDALARQIPFTKAKVETVLLTRLVVKDTSGNPIQNTAFQFYTGGPVKLSDDAVISNVDLRIRHKEGHPGFLVLDLDGECISLDAVRSHYSILNITNVPHGHSPDEMMGYTTLKAWGKLSFGFTERHPDCLAAVSFNPKMLEADETGK